jgi:hypothetical protein
MMKNRFRIISLVVMTLIAAGRLVSQDMIDSQNYGFGENIDCTPAALEMIRDAKKKGITRINIASGTYHFYPDKAFEKFCFISNHDDGLRSTPFPILGFNELEIRAEKAHFIFHGLMVPFIIEDSEDIHLSGFTIDWEMPLASEALVVASDPGNRSFDLKIDKDQPYEIRNGELFFLKEGSEHNLDRALYWDPKTGAVAYMASDYEPKSTRTIESTTRFLESIEYPYEIDPVLPIYKLRGVSNSVFADEIEPGLVRISFQRGIPPKEGLVIVCKGLNGDNRLAPAIRIARSANLEIQNVSIYSAGGMGVIAELSSNIVLDGVRVEPSPGKGRMLSTSADATHFVNCRGSIRMLNSVFSNQLDDATNVHGIFLKVAEKPNGNKLGVQVGHYQQLGFDFGIAGDKIAFIDFRNSYTVRYTATLKGITKVNKRYFIIEFEEELNPQIDDAYVIENLSATPDLEIRNCSIINNRARGILISTPGKTIVEGNYFSTMMSAILVPTELSFWYESGYPVDLTIRNNVFGDCTYDGRKSPIINIHADVKGDNFVFRNILIEDNTFNSFDASVLSVNKASGFIFRNNLIKRSGNYEPLHPEAPVISIRESENVILEKNIVESGFDNKLEIDASSKKGAVIKRNKGF